MIRPDSIRLEASSFCQLRCPSCPTTTRAIDPAIGKGFLKFSDFQDLLEKNPWVKKVELSNYGEIFLNPELLEMMEYAYRHDIRLTAGNGVNLNHAKEDVLEGLVRYQFGEMTCSIDGASQETYSVYRVKGDFDNVIAHIQKINEHKKRYRSDYPILAWQFIVFGHNEHEIPKARAMARDLDMDFRLKLTWDSEFSPIRDAEMVRREVGAEAVTREEFRDQTGKDYMERICYQLWNKPQINWDGKLLGCCRNFWGDFGANVFQDGLENSLGNEKISYAREMLIGNKEARQDIPCTTCEIYLGMKETGKFIGNPQVHKTQQTLQPLIRRIKRKLARSV